jgi:hypothetical protein
MTSDRGGIRDVGRPQKWTRQKRALALLGAVIYVLVAACVEFSKAHYANGFSLLLIVLGFFIWLVMTQVETDCGALRANRKAYCTKRIRGLLFGCKDHTWQRPLSFIGIGNRPIEPRQVPTRSQPTGAAASVAIPALIPGEREHRRAAITFWVAIGSLTAGILSSFTDVFNFVKDL